MRLKAVTDIVMTLVMISAADAFSWPKWGRCPTLSVEQNFDVMSYLGTWYQQAGYNTEMVQGDVRCVSADYLPAGDGQSGQVLVHNQAILQSTNKIVSINGTAVQTNPSKNEGRLTVTFYFWKYFPMRGDYWVLGTDYDTYSLVYSCRDVFFLWHYDSVWALSRSQTFDTEEDEDDFYKPITKTLWSNKLAVYLTETSQTNCDV